MGTSMLGINKTTGNPYRVMLVDDSGTVRNVIKSYLVEEGFKVSSEAENGKEAIDRISLLGNSPDILLLDMEMPVLGGIETLKQIREMGLLPNTHIFMVTSRSELDMIKQAVIHKIAGYIVKPFKKETLMGHIQKALKITTP